MEGPLDPGTDGFGIDLADLQPPLNGTPLDEPAERKVAPAERPRARKKLPAEKPPTTSTKAAKGKKKVKAGSAGSGLPAEAPPAPAQQAEKAEF